MKTKEEIEQLANEWTNGIDESYKVLLKAVYVKGYTQCQEDMKIVISEWQLCPMCLGEGQTTNNGISSSTFRICPVCNGSRTLIKPYLNKQD